MAKLLTKTCSKCSKTKLTSEFYKDITKLDGLHCNCKTCSGKATLNWYRKNRASQLVRMRKYHQEHKQRPRPKEKRQASEIKYRHGLTWAVYQQMVKKQNGVCAICGKQDSSGRRLSIDHDHVTGKVRGLLCLKCNRALGLIGDSVPVAKMIVKYLRRTIK